MTKSFTANGKLLISGEYFVLDGALALALPTKTGQQLKVEVSSTDDQTLHWQSLNVKGKIWFQGKFRLPDLQLISSSDAAVGERLQSILQKSKLLNSSFLNDSSSKKVVSKLEFPNEWGLGTSSTLIFNIAQWADVDPYSLLEGTFGGSGYDIACASADGPIFYQRNGNKMLFQETHFQPSFSDQLYFVYLGKKQNSREGIARYRAQGKIQKPLIDQVSQLTKNLSTSTDLANFENFLKAHEKIVAQNLKIEKVQDLYFSDFWGVVKSLGAWGGDFVLVTSHRSEKETREYFEQKGFGIFIRYEDMVL